MWNYYLRLASISIFKTPYLSLMMVLAIATGIAACLTVLTMYSVISSNPLEHKNGQTFAVQLGVPHPDRGGGPNGLSAHMSYLDAEALYQSGIADEIVIMQELGASIQKADFSGEAAMYRARATTRGFFSLFDVHFVFGGSWDDKADVEAQSFVIISEGLNNRLFDGRNSVGESILLERVLYTIVGVVSDNWRLAPSIYDLFNDPFKAPPDIYFPFFNIAHGHWAAANSWALGPYDKFLKSGLSWVQVWASLNSLEKRQTFLQFIENYIDQQKQNGRFQGITEYYLNTPREWLKANHVVTDDNRILLALSFAYLAVCLANAMVLLLAKFLRKAPEVGIRRALGATRQAIFAQHLAESFFIGLAGGLLGLAFSWLGLAGVRDLYSNYQHIAAMNTTTFFGAFILGVLASICSGFLPAWRISRAAPAKYLKP